ncbi:MAG: hypothetical protein HKP58_02265 [Desulfatitalea sp.]|nr:hypothetical protein [Desulfatitalea sp.]NNJ99213.1 hypothetical protein [Desulfatitalea sp.]
MVQEIINSYTNNPSLLGISAIAFAIGYIEYVYSFRLVIREKSAPFPVWMHTFYFAHDFTAAVVFFKLARQYDYFWFFTLSSIALLVWNCFEIFNLYMAVKVERQEIWGECYSTPVTEKQAVLKIIGQIAIMAAVVNLFRVYMNDVVMFKWLCFTNIIMAVGPGYLWAKRKRRTGTSVGLSIVIFAGTVNTFLPPGYGMWTTALNYFDQPWFYITGIIISAVALNNIIMLLRFPAKEHVDGTKKPIW